MASLKASQTRARINSKAMKNAGCSRIPLFILRGMMVPSARLRFIVDAEPRSQGSMTAVYNRRLGVSRVRHANAPALSLWRNLIREAARMENAQLWTGPIGMQMSFGLRAPLDTRHGYPKSPDLDKLIRGVLDALTTLCYVDDSQVVRIDAEKVWRSYTEIEVYRIERQHPQRDTAQLAFTDF
jgi:crossover junction endodeoxyribonuclease RusA